MGRKKRMGVKGERREGGRKRMVRREKVENGREEKRKKQRKRGREGKR